MDAEYRKKIEKTYVKREPDVKPGDTVSVHLRISEAGKERIQIFEGVVIRVKGTGLSKTITVRKMSHGVGVEKILPVNSPLIKKIDIVKRGNVRRAKLYYMRTKVGKRSLDVTLDEQFEAIMEDGEDESEEAPTDSGDKDSDTDAKDSEKKKEEDAQKLKDNEEEKKKESAAKDENPKDEAKKKEDPKSEDDTKDEK